MVVVLAPLKVRMLYFETDSEARDVLLHTLCESLSQPAQSAQFSPPLACTNNHGASQVVVRVRRSRPSKGMPRTASHATLAG